MSCPGAQYLGGCYALQIVFTNYILKITFKFRQMGHVLILLDEMGLDEKGINLWD